LEEIVAEKEYNLDQPMDSLINLAVKKFGEVEFQPVSVGDHSFFVLQIKNMQQYIDKLMDKTRAGKTVSLPLWAKIWPASLVLGHSLSKFSLGENKTVLEIGAGAALSSMVFAKRGLRVTLADQDQDALLFSRINILKNGLEARAKTVKTDFKTPLAERYDCVVGAELLYDEQSFNLLAPFVEKNLIEGLEGEVFFSLDLKRAARNFFASCNTHFNIMKSTVSFKDQETGDDRPVNLFRFKRKEQ